MRGLRRIACVPDSPLSRESGRSEGGPSRRAGSIYTPPAGAPIVNVVQGIASTYPLTPPRTYGIELQYRFR